MRPLRRLVPLVTAVAVLGACGNNAANGTKDEQAAATTAAAPTTAARTTVAPATTLSAGAAYSFRGMTITLRSGWKLNADKDGATIANGAPCIKSKLLGPQCPGFTVDGPVGIASAYENRPYQPDRIYHPGTDVSLCLTAPDAGYEDTGRSRLVRGGFARSAATPPSTGSGSSAASTRTTPTAASGHPTASVSGICPSPRFWWSTSGQRRAWLRVWPPPPGGRRPEQ